MRARVVSHLLAFHEQGPHPESCCRLQRFLSDNLIATDVWISPPSSWESEKDLGEDRNWLWRKGTLDLSEPVIGVGRGSFAYCRCGETDPQFDGRGHASSHRGGGGGAEQKSAITGRSA
jgi:hypothetical protein